MSKTRRKIDAALNVRFSIAAFVNNFTSWRISPMLGSGQADIVQLRESGQAAYGPLSHFNWSKNSWAGQVACGLETY